MCGVRHGRRCAPRGKDTLLSANAADAPDSRAACRDGVGGATMASTDKLA
jgi:hypothetical protein